jgi:hypothetical protein
MLRGDGANGEAARLDGKRCSLLAEASVGVLRVGDGLAMAASSARTAADAAAAAATALSALAAAATTFGGGGGV